jgi:hypothetical protein
VGDTIRAAHILHEMMSNTHFHIRATPTPPSFVAAALPFARCCCCFFLADIEEPCFVAGFREELLAPVIGWGRRGGEGRA